MATIRTLTRIDTVQIIGRSFKFHCFFDNNTDQGIYPSALGAYEDKIVEFLRTYSQTVLARFHATSPLPVLPPPSPGINANSASHRDEAGIAAGVERQRLLDLVASDTTPVGLHMTSPILQPCPTARIWVKVNGQYHATPFHARSTTRDIKTFLGLNVLLVYGTMKLLFNRMELHDDWVLVESGVFNEASLQLI